MRHLRALGLALVGLMALGGPLDAAVHVEAPAIVHTGRPLTLELSKAEGDPEVRLGFSSQQLSLQVRELLLSKAGGQVTLVDRLPRSGRFELVIEQDGEVLETVRVTAVPGVLSIVPPLLAIVAAVALRQVVVALFMGLWLGASLVAGLDPLGGLLETVHVYVVGALADADHAAIIVFSMLLGGMVGVISGNGGTRGIVDVLSRFARTARSGQLATFLIGIGIFFDDYANALIVGNTMRPVCDRLRISRAKLSYIVDSTSAPVASVALISTWIGMEVSLIRDGLEAAGHAAEAYHLFVRSIPYRFYPLLALLMVLLVAVMGRDFGPMLKAERRARREGKLSRGPDLAVPEAPERGRWWNAVLPIATVLVVTLAGIWATGSEAVGPGAGLSAVFESGNSYYALLWGSLSGCLMAVGLTLAQRQSGLEGCMKSWLDGVGSMLPPLVVLTLAWGLQAVTERLGTADYLVEVLSDTMAPQWLPLVIFVAAAVISFATGTSWGTMPILMPIVIPLVIRLSQQAGLSAAHADIILVGSVSSVLAGSVFGDHCSPLSDTTILSSMASSVEVIEHVSTQLPYAVFVALVGILLGDIPSAWGVHPALCLVLGAVTMVVFLRFVGRKPDEAGDL